MRNEIKIKRIAAGTYSATISDRTFEITFSASLNEWKIYEGEEWWETVPTLRDAKEYIRGLA